MRPLAIDRSLAIDLFLFGLFVTGFSILGHQLQDTIRPAVLAGAAVGGIFLSVLAIFGARGYCTQAWTLATLSLLAVLLLVQAAKSWFLFTRGPSAQTTSAIITMLCIFALGQLVTLVRTSGKTPSARKDQPRPLADAEAPSQDRNPR